MYISIARGLREKLLATLAASELFSGPSQETLSWRIIVSPGHLAGIGPPKYLGNRLDCGLKI
jgi:hypothetical protein